MLEEVSAAFQESQRAAAAAAQALREAEASAAKAKQREEESTTAAEQAKKKEAESKVAAEQARAAEEDARAAQAELEAALAEVQAQEDAYNQKKSALEKKCEEGGVVSKNKAKAELAQHLAEDPLPLRKAKITQEAAVKRADRATQAASTARTNAEAAANNASAARADAERAANEATYLEEVKSRPGCAHGAIWWIDRELHEQRKYL
eukprot:CAMPEP_0206211170 /NCGR_PEP_ID=MMETSP0166-20121206/17981_1 /ASSEMBLY_ACC=CAM_ASM_000260 /TAXON_ID=95228 /ORGANISM="Vannella robusta, Strain DIVA3 518/3/11/1/6" /LENGTH=206 /DNA_ID=CAMNT_0053632979 /DNA_START=122 /DNA_END=739 /DNA_ORIENTATION=-